MDSTILQVEAIYPFKGKNNDELCFTKGSVITVTQNDDETWWEGTLDGNTGWFPANYVRPLKTHDEGTQAAAPGGPMLSPNSEQQMYRALVLRNILDSERQHISEMSSLVESCLKPLSTNKLLCGSDEYSTLLYNLERIISVHEQFLSQLESEGEKASGEQRVGGVFLKIVVDVLSTPHQQYCSQHPKAVAYLQEHKNEINRCVENSGICDGEDGQKKPGILVLTTGLSKPFRRLQQYSGLLQELHRHLPEAHKDRGDAHRAAKVMADLSASCSALRRQKELELEVVTRQIAGWEKGTLGVLGDVKLMGSVALYPNHTDRYFVLFPKHFVILGVSPRMSNFIFKSKHNISDIVCRKLEDCEQYKNAFELKGNGMEPFIAVCQTKNDQQQWVNALSSSSAPPSLPAKNLSLPMKKVPLPPHKAPPIPPVVPPSSQSHTQCLSSSGSPSVSSGLTSISHKAWGLCDLRPSPPLRPHQLKRMKNTRKDEKWHDEDSIILRVVEAYCSSTATRYTQAPILVHGNTKY